MAKKRAKKTAPAKPTEPPMCSCLLLCDDVIVTHARGGKHHLHGVIGTIALPLPAISGGHVVYMRLTNVYPNAHVMVGFENADNGELLWQFRADFLPSSQPLGVNTMIVNVPPFQIKAAGRYILRANYDDIPIAQTPITVQNVQLRKEGADDGQNTPPEAGE